MQRWVILWEGCLLLEEMRGCHKIGGFWQFHIWFWHFKNGKVVTNDDYPMIAKDFFVFTQNCL